MAKKHAPLVEAESPDDDVTLYPTEPIGDARVPGVPAVVMTVSAKRAAELLAYQPPAFTLEPPHSAGDGDKED